MVTDQHDTSISVDVETQAILRLDQQVSQDMKDSKEPNRIPPLCIGQADLLADDILRILAYEPYIPRSVLVDYIKTLMAFHLSLYHLKLLYMLPEIIKGHAVHPFCTSADCPADSGKYNTFEGCPFQLVLIADMGDADNKRMIELAEKSADNFYRRIPTFVQANFTIKKLDEMAEYLSKKTGRISPPSDRMFSVSDLASLLDNKYDTERDAYFKFRLAALVEESGSGAEDLDPEIREVLDMGLNDFDSFIEIIMAYQGRNQRRNIIRCIDALMLKNKETGLLAQSGTGEKKRRFVLGSRLLEILLQLAVLTWDNGQFVTRELRIESLLEFLFQRYGIYIDRLPETWGKTTGIHDRHALRLNLESFKRRLREIGFYEDLSDAYVTQKVTPRYKIDIK